MPYQGRWPQLDSPNSLGPQQKLIARLEATLVAKYAALSPLFNERARRLWAAAESVAIAYGGDAVVSSATGLSRTTIPVAAANWSTAGRQRAVSGSPAPAGRDRDGTTRPGGGARGDGGSRDPG